MGLNSCYAILKYVVILINLIFWVIGLGILALAIWLLVDPSAYISVTQDEASFKSGMNVILAIGILILIVGVLGCCGACSESQCLLISFFCTLLLVIVAEIAVGAWIYTNKTALKDLVKVSFQKTIEEEYGVIDSRTVTIDTIQQELHCCGANGPRDWANSWLNAKNTKLDLSVSSGLQNFEIPESCCNGDKDDIVCKTGRIGQGTLPISPIIYEKGCVSEMYKYLKSYAPIIIGVIVSIALLEILGLILSLILCCAVRFVDRYKA